MSVEKQNTSLSIPDAKVLLVDDVPANLRLLLELLKGSGLEVATAINGLTALKAAPKIMPDLVLLDIMLPDVSGYEVCRRLKADPETADIPVIFISALGESFDKLQAFAAGGVDYIAKPFFPEEVLVRVWTHIDLRRTLQAVREQKRLLEKEKAEREKTEQELGKYQEQISGFLSGQLLHPEVFSRIVTQNEKMHSIFQYVEALACSTEPVLIVGESGVGKELIARTVHDVCSPGGPWVAINVAGFDDNHFSDPLFGHKKGAYTDARQERSGMVKKASGGTLFLDEIGDLSQSSQIKLLRLLQEKEYLPLGSDQVSQVECSIIVATNVDLKKNVVKGTFRQDLYFRLATHCVEIPPLRERKDDIPLLLEHFLFEAARKLNKKKPPYPVELPLLLNNYSYPGNIREFRSLVYDAMSRHQKHMLSMERFSQVITGSQESRDLLLPPESGTKVDFKHDLPGLKELSELLIREALSRTNGNQSMAAKLIGITPSALNMRLKKYAKT